MSDLDARADPDVRPVLLACSRLSKSYGRLRVLDDVDLQVAAGEAVGIVGPNGAGKTTLLNALAGSVTPDRGTVSLSGREVTTLRPEGRCRLGIGRAFQIPRPFGGMTVLENVIVGAAYGAGVGRSDSYARSIDVLRTCGLIELANRRAESLGLLHRKRLELARALATNPKILLLDEIGGGLTDAEADELVETIRALHNGGVAIVWIEHIVHVLLRVVDRLVAMDAGRIIADGAPQTVLQNVAVVDAYLGEGGRVNLLEVTDLEARHGLLKAVRGISLTIADGETVALVGANGAGKTTLLRTIAGAHPAAGGRVEFDGADVTRLPAHQRVARGLVLVPEGRRLFPEMTVEENLLVAGRRARAGDWTVDSVLDAFPMLRPLRGQRASQLSGGQQQAASIGRALMTNPRLLLIDEVSLGLAPIAVDAVYESVSALIAGGATVVLVEQDLNRAMSVADRVVCVLEGRIVLEAATGSVTREQITAAYFGVRTPVATGPDPHRSDRG